MSSMNPSTPTAASSFVNRSSDALRLGSVADVLETIEATVTVR